MARLISIEKTAHTISKKSAGRIKTSFPFHPFNKNAQAKTTETKEKANTATRALLFFKKAKMRYKKTKETTSSTQSIG
ncbi:MAG: hypothetical protein II368_05780 [Clostridia bacterium]|nr:hypothetical protein [Clostridia bacterium]